jgi:hypothetical protein
LEWFIESILERFIEFIFDELSVTLFIGTVVCGVTVGGFGLLVLSTWANKEKHIKVPIKDINSVFIK